MRPNTLWGVSFDACACSGVVTEFVKLARQFHDRGFTVHLDLGYDIKADKHAFFRPYRTEPDLFPAWLQLSRVDGIDKVPGYTEQFVAALLREVVGADAPTPAELPGVIAGLRDALLATWERLGVTHVLVENGTLPENIAFTRALYQAVEEYGQRHRLGRFVLWRDHDLMWQSEPSAHKYGPPPYPHAVRPVNSPFIHYLVLHQDMLDQVRAWAPGLANLDWLPNTFPARCTEANHGFRRAHGIPEDVPLLARCTRIIPQKRIDRDIYLLAAVAERTDAYLFIAGDRTECPAEWRRLTRLAIGLGVADRVVFGGILVPYGAEDAGGPHFSVRDLLATATALSFLTSYDYESYGNPIGEAIMAGVPYLTTRYACYDAVYGRHGCQAPVLEVTSTDLPTAGFADDVADLLLNPERRAAIAAANRAIGERLLSPAATTELLDRLFLTPMPEAVRMSVVLPVYNEAANLPAVLDALYHQRGPTGQLDRSSYEIVVVDNNSTDDTAAVVRRFADTHPDLAVHLVPEAEQGVSCARRTGMAFASARSRGRGAEDADRFLLVSADADCPVDPDWLGELYAALRAGKAAIGVCDYYYEAAHFAGRPRLWDAISRTLRCRAVTFALFGGFPDGKGFAVDRDAHDRAGGIEICYQVHNGRFVNHLSDDWDFGIRLRALGEDISYVPRSRVCINPRRVDHALEEVITGRAYGQHGIIVMRDIRPDHEPETEPCAPRDLTPEEARLAWEFSIKDFVPKNTVLPVLLTPSLLDTDAVIEFFGADLARRLANRIAEIRAETRLVDLTPIHAYKTPSYRLYFEFADELFARLRAHVGADIGGPPPLPECLRAVPPHRFTEFVRHYCEDRESGAAHDYFGNGGVF